MSKVERELFEAAALYGDFKLAAERGTFDGGQKLQGVTYCALRGRLESAARAYATYTRKSRHPSQGERSE